MCIISDTRHGVMRAENRYGQMFLKSMFLRMKELGVSQTECVARMKTSRPAVSKALHGGVSAVRFAKALWLDFFRCLSSPQPASSMLAKVINIFQQWD